MIEIPEDGWGFGPAGDAPRPGAETLLTGWPAPTKDGYLVVPGAEFWGMQAPADDDPVLRADTMRERAGAVFKRQRAVGAFSRELDDLFTTVTEDPDWSKGLEHFDRSLAELRRKHADGLQAQEDRDAFERHAGQFGAMQRIGLKRALVERQQADALSQLDEQLNYYVAKATAAPNDVFRSIAVDSGLQAIAELRDAGYLFPEAAQKLEVAFRGRLDSADLEAIVKASPDTASLLLDDKRLFANADAATRDRLRQQVAGLLSKSASDAVPALGEALGYFVGEATRAGNHPESTRKDPVLGVSLGEGEMPGSAAERPDGPLDREPDDDGDDAVYFRDKPGYHRYVQGPTALGTEAEGLTEAMVKDALGRFAVPGQNPTKPVEHDKIYAVYPPGGRDSHYSVGNVRTTVADDGMSIRNKAQKGHIFYPGNIDRRIHLENGTWYVTTIGEGNNERPVMDAANQKGGPVVFELVDNQMKKYLRDQIAK